MGHLILVRHSATEASGGGRNLGQRSDPPLSGIGADLAQRLGVALRSELAELPAEHVRLVASSAERCRQTLRAVDDALGLAATPEVEGALIEIDYGAWEGLTAAECRTRDPELRARWEADPFATRSPDGESGSDVVHRAFPVFERIESWLSAARGRACVVVAHNHVNRLRLTALLGWPMARYRDRVDQDPAGYSIVGFLEGHVPVVRRVNVQPA
jgi:ribonuclease H / adenosylcobalamin/alpha-ribazole phosphatase